MLEEDNYEEELTETCSSSANTTDEKLCYQGTVWTKLGKDLLFVSSIKTGIRRIMRLDELSSVAILMVAISQAWYNG